MTRVPSGLSKSAAGFEQREDEIDPVGSAFLLYPK